MPPCMTVGKHSLSIPNGTSGWYTQVRKGGEQEGMS